MFLTRAVVFLQHSAMAESSAAAAARTVAPTKLDELLEITAQSLVRTEVAEHYEVIRELGRGKYGHVMLVTHRQRGKELTAPYELLCLASSPLARALGRLVPPWGQAPGMVGRPARQGPPQPGTIPLHPARKQVMPGGRPEHQA